MKTATAIMRAERMKEVDEALRGREVLGLAINPMKGHHSKFSIECKGRSLIFVGGLLGDEIKVVCSQNIGRNVVEMIHRNGAICDTSIRKIRVSTEEKSVDIFRY